MQVNEHVSQVQQPARLPDIDRAFENKPATPEARAELTSAEPSRRPSTRPPARNPGHYGAGF